MFDYLHHYFEFIPEEEVENASPTILEAHELERDRNYYILLTTSSGFYRYNIYDVVQCVGFHGQVPVIKFFNKGTCFLASLVKIRVSFKLFWRCNTLLQPLKSSSDTLRCRPNLGTHPVRLQYWNRVFGNCRRNFSHDKLTNNYH